MDTRGQVAGDGRNQRSARFREVTVPGYETERVGHWENSALDGRIYEASRVIQPEAETLSDSAGRPESRDDDHVTSSGDDGRSRL